MKKMILLVCCITGILCAKAQHQVQYDTLSKPDFLFESYTAGSVFQKAGAPTEAPLNYDAKTSSVYFVPEGGQPLILDNLENIDSVVINKIVFRPVEGKVYIQLYSGRETLLMSFFGKRHPMTGVVNHKGYSVEDKSDVKEDVTNNYMLWKTGKKFWMDYINEYWILSAGGKLQKINSEKSVIKSYPQIKDELKNYIEKNHVVFSGDNPKSLIGLTAYINGLSAK